MLNFEKPFKPWLNHAKIWKNLTNLKIEHETFENKLKNFIEIEKFAKHEKFHSKTRKTWRTKNLTNLKSLKTLVLEEIKKLYHHCNIDGKIFQIKFIPTFEC